MVAKKGRKPPKNLQSAIEEALGSPAADTDSADLPETDVKREEALAATPEPIKKLVAKWQTDIRADKKYFKDVFARMREDMEYARLGADKKWVDAGNYTVPVINRFINMATAILYAKNPKAVAKRKPKLMYKIWDGTQATLKSALQLVQTGADQDGTAAQILQEAQGAQAYDQMMTRAGRTLEILFEYYTGVDFPDFKKRMKSAVRRAKTVGVSYVEIGIHRATEADPDVTQRIGDATDELALIQSRKADMKDEQYPEDDPRATELHTMLVTLEQEKMKIIAEGLVFDFPRSTDIIPSRKCTQLSGFIGAPYITREFLMEQEEIQKIFKVDVGSGYTVFAEKDVDAGTTGNAKEGDRGDSSDSENAAGLRGIKQDKKGKACVWHVFSKQTRQHFWLCDGYAGYLKPPEALDIQVHGFWPVYALILNEVEDEKEIFPPSDVNYMKDPGKEYNTARQGMREHRKANRPRYFTRKGMLEEDEKRAVSGSVAHEVIELKNMDANMTIDKIIQSHKPAGIDPNLYETGTIMKDILYGVGSQSADLGATGDATATESSIAETSRMSTNSSNTDDLDEFLSEIARGSSQAMLQQLSVQTVTEIVGPGAIWPSLDAETISKELFLEIKAGSSGRPNAAQELAALERGMNFLIQLGNVSPVALARKYSRLLDIDEDELIVEGLPSIITMNAMAQQAAQAGNQVEVNHAQAASDTHFNPTGAPGSAGQPAAAAQGGVAAQPHQGPQPQMQAHQGANNAPQPAGVTPQGQPGFPSAMNRHAADGGRVI